MTGGYHPGPTTPSKPGERGIPSTPELTGRNLFNRPFRSSNLHQVVVTTPESSPISPSVVIPNTATRRNTFSRKGTAMSSSSLGSPYYGPSSSVSSLGFDTAVAVDDDSDVNNQSSSDDEFMGYDSDDRVSLSSRRPSIVSIGGAGSSNGIYGANTMNNTSLSISSRSSLDEGPRDGFSSALSGLGITSKESSKEARRTIIRQTFISGKSLKPKIKSLLRISKDLQEESSPLDYEMKREAEVTNNFRQEEDEDVVFKSAHPKIIEFPFKRTIETAVAGGPRINQPSDTDDSDFTNGGGSPPPQPPAPHSILKRKVDDNPDSPGAIKRRAVSPVLSSPVMASTPGGMNKRASIRQVQDTSDGFQNMKLA
jgi:hypothetical protein